MRNQKFHCSKSSFISFFIASLTLSSSSFLNICLASESEVEDEHQFSYKEESGKGPKNWGKINPNWKICGTGKLQSPIDIIDHGVEILPSLGKLKRDYQPAPAIAKNRGHDVMISWEGGDAGTITINGTDYKLLQTHWHSPSEHKIKGARYDAEMHLVHESSNGVIAVVGILFKYGAPDPFLSKVLLLGHIKPLDPEDEKELGIINPGQLKFGTRKYYRYIGSLTVPPCTEGEDSLEEAN
ncbi:alpha carbonic anhydrase 4-like isoform X2 [Carica papaya]|uniref:alpha carbonic anhydrase 4-like isoform X2 n=1 Tax=Carica papaya TaxID=3649 RepID=UPI000B8CD8F3|nr:alpha carbonic anhydrase 4-like isoform X2 [Carica papaya]XP_021887897.1 alpha carbonic anhydrase 4-like isoform X2 [Carica papaya]